MDELMEVGQSRQGSIHCLSIIGQIEGHQVLPEENKTTKYEHILPMLAAIEESDEVDGLLVLLNTGRTMADINKSMDDETDDNMAYTKQGGTQ